MTSLLLALLIWILIGGLVWMLISSNAELFLEVGKEEGYPTPWLEHLRTSKSLLIVTLIIGPAIIIPSIIAGIYNYIKDLYKGDSKCPKN